MRVAPWVTIQKTFDKTYRNRKQVHSCFLFMSTTCVPQLTANYYCMPIIRAALIVPGKDVKEIELKLTKVLESISNWLTDNKRSLHLGKTESILFGTKKKRQSTSSQLNVTCGGTILSAKSTVKYLGVELDQHLSGEYIARNAISNINNKVKFLLRNTNLFNMKVTFF